MPYEVGKNIGGDTIFASAWLSELKEMGKVKISYLKVGGSPLYFLPGQEAMIQHFSSNLEDKEKQIYETLKQKKVVRDSALVPVFRAAMRELRDFAIPLNVQYEGTNELFWKWYLTPAEEANSLIKSILNIKEEKKEMQKIERKIEVKKPETETIEEKKIEQKKTEERKSVPEIQQKISTKAEDKSEFNAECTHYFMKNKIVVVEMLLKKASEIEAIVELPSSVGNLRYYVKAKSKKKITDGDLSSAFVKGQSKRLPVLILTTGELTKKAREMLEAEFKGMRFNHIGS